jgi:hypothetical protein
VKQTEKKNTKEGCGCDVGSKSQSNIFDIHHHWMHTFHEKEGMKIRQKLIQKMKIRHIKYKPSAVPKRINIIQI